MSSSPAKPKGALKKKAQFFTAKSEGVKYLVDQFRKFDADPETGINFRTRQNDEIRKIFSQHPIFSVYSERAFVDQFKRYANNFQLEETRRRIPPPAAASAAVSKPPAKRPVGKFFLFLIHHIQHAIQTHLLPLHMQRKTNQEMTHLLLQHLKKIESFI